MRRELKDKVKYWNDKYWPDLQKATDDSEEKLEKYSTTISMGAIALILGTMGFQNKPDGIGWAIAALSAFVVSFLLFIIYHIVAIKKHNKQFDMIRAIVANPETDDETLQKSIIKSNGALDIFFYCRSSTYCYRNIFFCCLFNYKFNIDMDENIKIVVENGDYLKNSKSPQPKQQPTSTNEPKKKK